MLPHLLDVFLHCEYPFFEPIAYMFRKAAINRLRAYRPPTFPLWDKLPVRKRAAVLILLYADRWGDLRVVITMRAANLRSFSGHAALPGGKADSTAETPCELNTACLQSIDFLMMHLHRPNCKTRGI